MCWTAGSGSAEVALLPRAVFVGGPEAAGGKACTEVAICKVKPRVRATITPAQVSSAGPGSSTLFVLAVLVNTL